MKIIGNDGKEYTGETLEEAIAKAKEADEQLKAKEEQEKEELEKQSKAISKEKKELSKNIEDTEVLLNNAYKDYEEVLANVRNLNAEHEQKVKDMLGEAEKKVANAKTAHYQAVRDFTRKYGAYRKVYTGEEAQQREKIIKDMFDAFNFNWNDWVNDLFDFYL